MTKHLVVARSKDSTTSRRVQARREAELLRHDAARAVDGVFAIRADRMREIADLLDTLVRRSGPAMATPVVSERSPAAAPGFHAGTRVEQDLAALLMRSVERGGHL